MALIVVKILLIMAQNEGESTVFKGSISSWVAALCDRWVVLMLKTWLVAHMTTPPPRHKNKAKTDIFTKENDKNDSNAQWPE